MKYFTIILLFVLLFSSDVFSQDTLLTLEKAIEISLKNNYDIRISKNLTEQQENNNTLGNAGMLPDVDVKGTFSKSSYSLEQKYNSGSEVNHNASGATNTAADLGANWTIFDGLKMFNTKAKLSELSMLSHDGYWHRQAKSPRNGPSQASHDRCFKPR